jgi:hypothetical protein
MSNIHAIPLSCATTTEALKTIDSLKEAIESGEIVGFAAVGIEPNDNTRMWTTTTMPISRLRMIGAMYHLLASFREDA